LRVCLIQKHEKIWNTVNDSFVKRHIRQLVPSARLSEFTVSLFPRLFLRIFADSRLQCETVDGLVLVPVTLWLLEKPDLRQNFRYIEYSTESSLEISERLIYNSIYKTL
jgi:hypothetical protein